MEMNTVDIVWMMLSSGMVLLMVFGLSFFYGGLVHENNVVNTMKMSLICLGLISLEWVLVGYSISFGLGQFWGGLSHVGLSGVGMEPQEGSTIPHLLFMVFQMMFAIITPALISGAVVGRMRFNSYIIFILLWSLVVYNPLCHWVWGKGGFLHELGALDFAGGTVIHISAGIAALVAASILGPRYGVLTFDDTPADKTVENPADIGNTDLPHNIPFVLLGTGLLWFGWFGFNAGSALHVGESAVYAFVNTVIAPAAALVVWRFIEVIRHRRSTLVGACIAVVVGLVGITPAAGFVSPLSSIAIGGLCALASYVVIEWIKQYKQLDDVLDVFACHGVSGIVGALLTGVFAEEAIGGTRGLIEGNPSIMVAQLISIVVAIALSAGGTAIILFGLKYTIGLRANPEMGRYGIDYSEHAESAYVHLSD